MHHLLGAKRILKESRNEKISMEFAPKEKNHTALSSMFRDKLPQKCLSAGVIAQSGSEDLKTELLSRMAEKIVGGRNIITLSWNLTVTQRILG